MPLSYIAQQAIQHNYNGSQASNDQGRTSLCLSAVATVDDDSCHSAVSTACSSMDEQNDNASKSTATTATSKSSTTVHDSTATKRSSIKRAIWKDKDGKARYTLHGDNLADTNHIQKGRAAVTAGVVTAGVVTGGVVGLVVLGPVGLVVGGVGGVGSAASALFTKRRLDFQRRRQRVQEHTNSANTDSKATRRSSWRSSASSASNTSTAAPLPEPPNRTFSEAKQVRIVQIK